VRRAGVGSPSFEGRRDPSEGNLRRRGLHPGCAEERNCQSVGCRGLTACGGSQGRSRRHRDAPRALTVKPDPKTAAGMRNHVLFRATWPCATGAAPCTLFQPCCKAASVASRSDTYSATDCREWIQRVQVVGAAPASPTGRHRAYRARAAPGHGVSRSRPRPGSHRTVAVAAEPASAAP
jgi:hypothetical protein